MQSQSHLVNWVRMESGLREICLNQTKESFHKESLLPAVSKILSLEHPDCFTNSSMLSLEAKNFLLKELNTHINLNFCRKMTPDSLVVLAIYICIHSSNKDEYIWRIMQHLSEEEQALLMRDIQELETHLEVLEEPHQFWKILSQKEEENSRLCQLVAELEERVKLNTQELNEATYERDQLVIEKRKILGQFRLSNMAEYEELCEQLRVENQENSKIFRNFQHSLHQLEQENSDLRDRLNERDAVISQLSNECRQLNSLHRQAQRQLEMVQSNFSRSFSKSFNNMCEKLSEGMDATRDESVNQSIQQFRNRPKTFHENILDTSNSLSNFGKSSNSDLRKSEFGKSVFGKSAFGRSAFGKSGASTQDIFRLTKNNINLSEKLNMAEQEKEQLKVRIVAIEDELLESESREKKLLSKIRKIEMLFNPFWQSCQASCSTALL